MKRGFFGKQPGQTNSTITPKFPCASAFSELCMLEASSDKETFVRSPFVKVSPIKLTAPAIYVYNIYTCWWIRCRKGTLESIFCMSCTQCELGTSQESIPFSARCNSANQPWFPPSPPLSPTPSLSFPSLCSQTPDSRTRQETHSRLSHHVKRTDWLVDPGEAPEGSEREQVMNTDISEHRTHG